LCLTAKRNYTRCTRKVTLSDPLLNTPPSSRSEFVSDAISSFITPAPVDGDCLRKGGYQLNLYLVPDDLVVQTEILTFHCLNIRFLCPPNYTLTSLPAPSGVLWRDYSAAGKRILEHHPPSLTVYPLSSSPLPPPHLYSLQTVQYSFHGAMRGPPTSSHR
jgi:hypothetical protein